MLGTSSFGVSSLNPVSKTTAPNKELTTNSQISLLLTRVDVIELLDKT